MFGCTSYAHDIQDNLQASAKKCIFLGYVEDIKRFKFWCIDLNQKKCLISGDMIFNETQMPMLLNVANASLVSQGSNTSVNLDVEPTQP